MNCWNVSRRGRAVRVDIEPTAVVTGESDQIVRAVEMEVAADDFESVHISGPLLDQPPRGTVALLRRLGEVAQRHGKRLDVGPI